MYSCLMSRMQSKFDSLALDRNVREMNLGMMKHKTEPKLQQTSYEKSIKQKIITRKLSRGLNFHSFFMFDGAKMNSLKACSQISLSLGHIYDRKCSGSARFVTEVNGCFIQLHKFPCLISHQSNSETAKLCSHRSSFVYIKNVTMKLFKQTFPLIPIKDICCQLRLTL